MNPLRALIWIIWACVLALIAGYVNGLHENMDVLHGNHAAALQRAAAAENDRDMLLACLNGRGVLVTRTGLTIEVTQCRTRTQTYQQEEVAGPSEISGRAPV